MKSVLVEKHTSKEELQMRLLRGLNKKEEVEEQLAKLEVLPEEFSSYEDLSSEYESKHQRTEQLKEEQYDLKNKRIALDATKPEKSVKELSEELELWEGNFLRKKEEGTAYFSVLNALESVLSTIDGQTYQPLEAKVNTYINRLTESRYSKVLLDGVQPHSLQNHSKILNLKQLSKGTLDTVALALRLGSAEFYLDSLDGFLIMDDPLVDLDPSRQKAAADVLAEFAATKQTIIFTCNDDTAKLLKKEYRSMQQLA
jgi:DNA repair protein SbcC/Rad50